MSLCGKWRWREWAEPGEGKAAKHSLNAPPPWLFLPACLLLLQLLNTRLIIPDCIDLSEKHDCCEYGKKQTFEDEEEKKDDCGWRGEGGTLPPLIFDTDDELVDAEEQAV